ncbi:hypothetical protein B0G69_6634 [Paraburkholderia sp. RAU2J]|nr:hypothetical protein B0G69_6634 [Paraburkholderia sp. RAU2J]
MPVDAEVLNDDRPVLNEETPVLSDDTPVERELTPVDKELTPVERELPTVDSELTPVLRLETAVEAEVLREDRPVLSELTPVESDETPVLRLEMPVLVDVLSASTARFVAFNCEPFTASVLSVVSRPAATFVICRSASFAPTLTTLAGAAPAKSYDFPPMVALAVGLAAAVTEPEPRATSPAFVVAAFWPIATEFAAAPVAASPRATALAPAAVAFVPTAIAFTPLAPSFA